MKISDAGLDLIKSFEGYHDRLPDGSCRAYLCPAKVWTIGWGCTEGIKSGMVWTKEKAEEALRAELAKFEAGVDRLVTVELNQNEYDALVSFAYNVGLGGLGKSSVLKKLNKGDRRGAAAAFKLWNKGGGRVLKGLVNRRAREATLFLTPIDEPDIPMPQAVEQSSAVIAALPKAIAPAGVGLLSGITVPAAPDLSTWTGWQGAGETLKGLGAFAWSNPGVTILLGVFILTLTFLPRLIKTEAS